MADPIEIKGAQPIADAIGVPWTVVRDWYDTKTHLGPWMRDSREDDGRRGRMMRRRLALRADIAQVWLDHFDPEVGDYAPATAEVAARFPLPGSRSNRQGQKKTSGSRAAARTRSRTRTASAILALAALLLASCSKPDAEPPSTPDVRIESKGDTTSAVRAILVGDVLILEGARVKEGGLLNSAVAWSNVAKVTADGVVWRGYRVTVVDGAPHMERVE